MSVYNKELIIDGEAVLSPEQQVYKNAKDIKNLKQYIKESYHTSTALTSSSVSVATEDVEGLGEASSGWLLTDDGLLFKITANDGTTVLIQFFSDISGPQGPAGQDGASLEIDDSSTSGTKVWSSQKTSNEIDLIRDKGIYYTTVSPTLDGGVYSLNVSDLGNNNTYTWQKYGDLIIYVNGDGEAKELWKCVGLNGSHTVMTVEKVADYPSGGTQTYKHYITAYYSSELATITFVIENDNNTPITTWGAVNDYLLEKGFIYDSQNNKKNGMHASGGSVKSGSTYLISAIMTNDTKSTTFGLFAMGSVVDAYAINNNFSIISDIII